MANQFDPQDTTTVHVRSMPTFYRAENVEDRKKAAQSFLFIEKALEQMGLLLYRHLLQFFLSRGSTNVENCFCPALGLSNWSIESLVGVIQNENERRAHESVNSVVSSAICHLSHIREVSSLLVHFPSCYKGAIGAVDCIGGERLRYGSSRTVVIDPHKFPGRHGLPVSIAHSFSTHKSQSLTLTYLIIDPEAPLAEGRFMTLFRDLPLFQE